MLKARKLNKGDKIGLISNSAPLAGQLPHRLNRGIAMLEDMGFEVVIGKNAKKVTGETAGTGQERADDINNFFADDSIGMIISAIGGDDSKDFIDLLDYKLIKKKPKIVVGFSDTTVFHFALYTQANLVSFYGPSLLNQFAENPQILEYTRNYFEKATMQNKPIGEIVSADKYTEEVLDWFEKKDLTRARKMIKNSGWQWLRLGAAEAPIMGGCISSMMHLLDTKYWPDFNNKILFWEISEGADIFSGDSLENVGQYLDRLIELNVFDEIKAMIIGRPYKYTSEQTQDLIELITKKVSKYSFPVLFNVDIGHTDPIITIPLGVRVSLDSEKDEFIISEGGVN